MIRTVSRDISPDPSTKDCDCYDFYQEKENQTDDELCQSIESMHEYSRKIEAQQAEIEMLNAELDKKVCMAECSGHGIHVECVMCMQYAYMSEHNRIFRRAH